MYSLILVAAMSGPAPVIAEHRRPFLSRLFGRSAKGSGCAGTQASSGCSSSSTTITTTKTYTVPAGYAKLPAGAGKTVAMPATAAPEAVGASGPARRVLLRFAVNRAIAQKERSGELSARDADRMRAVMRDPDLRGAVLTRLNSQTGAVSAGERPFLEFLMGNWQSIALFILELFSK